MHDAVEMFLLVLCDIWDAATTRKTDFIQYFDALSAAGLPLERRESMKRLNGARVLLKHQGIAPSTDDIEALRAATTNFLEDNAPKAIGMAYTKISLSETIANAEIRRYLVDAESALASEDLTSAMTGAAVAFRLTMLAPNSSASRSISRSDGYTLRGAALRGLSSPPPIRLSTGRPTDVEKYAIKIGEAVNSSAEVFGEAVTLIGSGVDFSKYIQFKNHAPIVWVNFHREPSVQWLRDPPTDAELVAECISFAVDVAILLSTDSPDPEPYSDI